MDILAILEPLWLLQAGHVNFSPTSWCDEAEIWYCPWRRGCHPRTKPSEMGSRVGGK